MFKNTNLKVGLIFKVGAILNRPHLNLCKFSTIRIDDSSPPSSMTTPSSTSSTSADHGCPRKKLGKNPGNSPNDVFKAPKIIDNTPPPSDSTDAKNDCDPANSPSCSSSDGCNKDRGGGCCDNDLTGSRAATMGGYWAISNDYEQQTFMERMNCSLVKSAAKQFASSLSGRWFAKHGGDHHPPSVYCDVRIGAVEVNPSLAFDEVKGQKHQKLTFEPNTGQQEQRQLTGSGQQQQPTIIDQKQSFRVVPRGFAANGQQTIGHPRPQSTTRSGNQKSIFDFIGQQQSSFAAAASQYEEASTSGGQPSQFIVSSGQQQFIDNGQQRRSFPFDDGQKKNGDQFHRRNVSWPTIATQKRSITTDAYKKPALRRDSSSGSALNRKWKRLVNDDVIKNDAPAETFTICCYNVLCQETLEANDSLYVTCSEQWLQWEHRWELISKELRQMRAEIFCLQEVNEKHHETHFKPFFHELGFEGVYKKRTGLKPDGCAVYWRKSRFVAEQVDFLEYQVERTFLDRDNVGIVARLALLLNPSDQSSSTNQNSRLIVANTHLLFNPGRGDIKLCQLAMLLANIKKNARYQINSKTEKFAYFPVLLCGDFNSLPNTPLYQFVTRGELTYSGMRRHEISGQGRKSGPRLFAPLLPPATGVKENCEYFDVSDEKLFNSDGTLRHDLGLRSVYRQFFRPAMYAPKITTYHDVDASCVDYIFYTDDSDNKNRNENSHCPRLVCLGRYELPSKKALDLTTGSLPNRFMGSDHLPLAAEFEFVY